MSVRPATHAGSWYSSSPAKLSSQLSNFLGNGAPVSGARIIVSPHAGYTYCGPTMGKAYASLDLSRVKRLFVLGPSHHVYFKNKALVSNYAYVETPLGNLKVDHEVIHELLQMELVAETELVKHERKIFAKMDHETDQDEHSLEMQFPMIYQTLMHRNISPEGVSIVPIMISHNSTKIDYLLGKTLEPFLRDAGNCFIVSSDFCHWGRRFNYTGYVGDRQDVVDAMEENTEIEMLTLRSKLAHHQVPIHKSIEILDKFGMELLSRSEGDKYETWKEYLEVTGNTICGEKPLGVLLCSLSYMGKGKSFHWCGYSQSSEVKSVMESSVSYGSGYCVL